MRSFGPDTCVFHHLYRARHLGSQQQSQRLRAAHHWIKAIGLYSPGRIGLCKHRLNLAIKAGNDFARETLALLRAKSPTSIAIGLRQLTRSPLTIEEALRLEYRLVSRVCRWPDFYEGIRAVIIDKDQKPTWSPARLEDVDLSRVESAFAPLPDDLVFAGED